MVNMPGLMYHKHWQHFLLFLLTIIIFFAIPFLYDPVLAAVGFIPLSNMIMACSVFVFAYLAIINEGKNTNGLKTIIIGFLLFNLILVYAYTPSSSMQIAIGMLMGHLKTIVFFGLIALSTVMLFFLATFLLKQNQVSLAVVIFILGILIVCLIYLSGKVYLSFNVNDETTTSFFYFKQLIANNLSVSAANANLSNALNHLLISNESVGTLSYTITTNNTFVTSVNYPALFFLSNVPFFMLANPRTIAGLKTVPMLSEAAVFLIILLFALSFSIKEEHLEKPRLGVLLPIILAMAIGTGYITSINTYVMLALLVLAYAYTDSKYFGILIGLCISIQEQLWLPSLLLLIYKTNNYGKKQGIVSSLQAIATFFAINAFFMMPNPLEFFSNILVPVKAFLFPSVDSFVFFPLLAKFGIPLTVSPFLFVLAIVGVCIAFAAVNKKKLVGLFAMLPFFVFSHSLFVYYMFFSCFTIFTFFLRSEKETKSAWISKYLRENPNIARISLATIILIGMALVVFYHAEYVSRLNVIVTNATLTYNAMAKSSVYRATLTYSADSNMSASVLLSGINPINAGTYGLYNVHLFNDSPCSVNCFINYNRINFYEGNHTTTMTLSVNTLEKDKLEAVMAYFYYDQYVYYPPNFTYYTPENKTG